MATRIEVKQVEALREYPLVYDEFSKSWVVKVF